MAALNGKTVLVIGGARGIGEAVCQRVVAECAAPAFTYRDRVEAAEQLVDALRAAGSDPLALCADASDLAALRRCIEEAAAHLGRIDILVFVVGTAITGLIGDYMDDAFDTVFSLNVRAPFLATQQAARHMGEGGGIIVFGSIVADRAPGAGIALYAASKAAMGGLVRGLTRDLGPRAITANLVQPGPIDTERNPADGPNAEGNRSPLAIKRHGRAEEVAGLVAYLASPEADFVTGSAYNIDGGWAA